MPNLETLILMQVDSMKALGSFNTDIQSLLSSTTLSEVEKVSLLIDALNKMPSNPIIGKQLCVFLQIINDAGLLSQFNLSDIETLFQLMIRLEPGDIELQMEYVYFLFNVLDKENEALSYYERIKQSTLSTFDKFDKHINHRHPGDDSG
jgi:hypothetical protein